MKKITIANIVFILLALTGISASASIDGSNISYTYVEGGYFFSGERFVNETVGGAPLQPITKEVGHGLFVGGSYALTSNMFIFSDYNQNSAPYAVSIPAVSQVTVIPINVRFSEFSAGIGFNVETGRSTSVFVKGGIAVNKSSVTNVPNSIGIESLTTTSGIAEAGVRVKLLKRFEFLAAAGWSGVYDPGNVFKTANDVLAFNTNDEFYGKIGLAYSASSSLSLRAHGVIGTSGRSRLAARLNF